MKGVGAAYGFILSKDGYRRIMFNLDDVRLRQRERKRKRETEGEREETSEKQREGDEARFEMNGETEKGGQEDGRKK